MIAGMCMWRCALCHNDDNDTRTATTDEAALAALAAHYRTADHDLAYEGYLRQQIAQFEKQLAAHLAQRAQA